ncbi:hypothetical protein PIB30_107297, partial [Stylosanthes scabra]|nr:hypothetical protein [Stylosanthes scabra]
LANDLIELVATNQYMYSSERGVRKGVMEVHTANPLEAMAKQISTMTKKLEKLEVAAMSPFGTTSLPHVGYVGALMIVRLVVLS